MEPMPAQFLPVNTQYTTLSYTEDFVPDIITIGAGPVGLLFAIEEALLAIINGVPKRNHLIFEKHEIYERLHVVILQNRAFKHYVRHPMFDPIMKDFRKAMNVPTNEIEEKFLKLAREQLGIRIVYEDIRNPRTLPQRYPSAKIIVGAGGSNGIIRREIFGNVMRRQKDFAYACEIKYRVKGKGKNFEPVDLYKMMKAVETIVDERSGRVREDGSSPVTTRFFINKQEYDALKAQNVTFRNPLTLAEQEKIPISLLERIKYWRQIKKQELGEEAIDKSEKITIVPLGFYSSFQFVKKDPEYNVIWTMVGDEACGAPLFTSLANGMEEAHMLARCSDSFFRRDLMSWAQWFSDMRGTPYRFEAYEGKVDANFIAYASFMLFHTDFHFTDISAKFLALDTVKAILYLNNNLPWQFAPRIRVRESSEVPRRNDSQQNDDKPREKCVVS